MTHHLRAAPSQKRNRTDDQRHGCDDGGGGEATPLLAKGSPSETLYNSMTSPRHLEMQQDASGFGVAGSGEGQQDNNEGGTGRQRKLRLLAFGIAAVVGLVLSFVAFYSLREYVLAFLEWVSRLGAWAYVIMAIVVILGVSTPPQKKNHSASCSMWVGFLII